MSAVRFVLTKDAQDFAVRTERLLSSRLECNVLATVLLNVLDGLHADPPPLFGYGLAGDGEVTFAAMRTPPWPLLTTPLEAGAEELVEAWLGADPEVPGVSGAPDTARAIAAAWQRRTGGTTRRTLSEAMHVLEDVSDPARPAPGELRPAQPSDRDLLVEWSEAFWREAGLAGAGQSGAIVDSRLRRGGLFVWDDGEPVSMIGVNPEVAGVVRIGPVYTPPAHRSRGYATSAVAAASRTALGGGADRCMLYTDLANPTSNKIYAEVGYRRCGEWEEIALASRSDPAG
jgi:RimJ/RimL family protein N-acetyltransferase